MPENLTQNPSIDQVINDNDALGAEARLLELKLTYLAILTEGKDARLKQAYENGAITGAVYGSLLLELRNKLASARDDGKALVLLLNHRIENTRALIARLQKEAKPEHEPLLIATREQLAEIMRQLHRIKRLNHVGNY